MAGPIVILALIVITFGIVFGLFLSISFAIGWEDRRRSLRFDAPSHTTRAARTLVGITGSRWG
jgi:hypothetical protein